MTPGNIQFHEKTLVLENNILSLDNFEFGHTCFSSNVHSILYRGELPKRQVLLSEEAYQLLFRKHGDLSYLPVGFNRPITLGHLTVELLRIGDELGLSALYATKNSDSLLYLSRWTSATTSASVNLKSPKNLVLKVPDEFESDSACYKDTDDEKKRLLQYASGILGAGQILILVASGLKDVIKLLPLFYDAQLPTACDTSISQILGGYSASVSHKPNWLNCTPLHKESKFKGILILSKEAIIKQRPKWLPQGIWAWIGPGFKRIQYNTWLHSIPFNELFTLENCVNANDLETLLKKIPTDNVTLIGKNLDKPMEITKRLKKNCRIVRSVTLDSLF